MDLFGALELGKRSLLTYQLALNVTGQNITNVATEGFTRRRVELQPATAVPAIPHGFLGTGVDAGQVTSVRDRMLEAQMRGETAREGLLDAKYGALQGVLSAVDESSSPGVGTALSALFDAFSTLATQPENIALRRTVVDAGIRFADVMKERYGRLANQRGALDQEVKDTVTSINTLTSRIAGLNANIARLEAGGREASDLRDSRAQAVKELARLVDISAYEDPKGNVHVSIASTGDSLVATDTATVLTTRQDPARGGMVSVGLTRAGASVDVTERLRGGRLGALLEARDVAIPATQADLDTLASAVMTEINRLHQAGFDLAGNAGTAFFAPTPPGTSAAAGMAVNPALDLDPSLVAAASSPAPGEGGTALAIAEIRKTRLASLNSATPAEFLGAAVGRVGFDAAAAEASLTAQNALLVEMQGRVDAVSGVSLDEEAIRLSQYQAAYNAAARFITTIDELTKVVMSMGASS